MFVCAHVHVFTTVLHGVAVLAYYCALYTMSCQIASHVSTHVHVKRSFHVQLHALDDNTLTHNLHYRLSARYECLAAWTNGSNGCSADYKNFGLV